MKFRFSTKEEAILAYNNSDNEFTKGEFVILYKAIVGQAPKKGKSRLDMQEIIVREIEAYRGR